MNRRGLTIRWNGEVHCLDHPDWFPPLTVGQRDSLQRGTLERDGKPLDLQEYQRVKRRLLAEPGPQRSVIDPSAPEYAPRLYVPGLMSHGTSPGFVAPKGWGKTKFLCDLCAAVVVPGYRFLKHFDPVQVTDEERERDVWMVNPETPVWAVHQELLRVGLVFGYRDGVPCYLSPDHEDGQGVLIVEHSVETGAWEFDLTVEEQYEWWVNRVTSSGVPPLTLISDSITAILRNQTQRTGEFTGRFKEFLKDADIPNGLGVLHSPMGVNVDTPMQGLESMGQWDGVWYGKANAFPIQSHHRREFYTEPRLNDPAVKLSRIVMDDDGTLRLVPPDPSKKDDTPKADRAERLLATLGKASEPLWTNEVCGEGDEYAKDKAVLERLAADGKVAKQKVQRGRSRGWTWALPTTD